MQERRVEYRQTSKVGQAHESSDGSYLGDILCHFAFPLSLYANSLFHPLLLLGPLTNLLFLRAIGGDKENEQSQAERYAASNPAKMVEFNKYQQEVNAVWPSVKEMGNKWTWISVAIGVAVVGLERVVRGYM